MNHRAWLLTAAVAAWATSAGAQTPPKAAVASPAKEAATTALADGRFGKALDARVASAVVPGHAELRTPPITVSCWARLADKKSYNILVASETKYAATHWELFTVAGSGRLTAFLSGMSPDHVRSDVDICDDRWHHLAMVYEPGRVRLYVDAKEVADQAIASKERTGRFEDIAIGALLEGGLRCAGLIDEVQIARGAHPVAKLPDGPPQVEKETVGLWHFDREETGREKIREKGSPASPRSRASSRFADASTAARHATPSYVVRSALESPPRVLDDRLTIELFAKEPAIVTPIGIVVDERDRLLVLESNTHFPPKGYSRHPSDRIVWLQDTNDDGKADKFTVFADGFTAAMHLTSHPDGSLYVATRGSIIRLRDKDGDGVADERTTLVRLETTCTYPHNGLFSVAFDWLNRMYISMGENLGADFKLVGSDGSVVTGGGEGGNIFRATADGGKVERIATGFWNPVQLHFDVFGRLFTVDNDPDSRPPCRLLHLVPGGDYGYRYRNGRAGLHPFTAWNGEVPGTLPMVAGTGEAPSGLLTCEFADWPEEHRGKMLVTSWGDYRIDLFTLERRGASFRADRQPLVTGGDDFRPVAMAAGRNGDVYVTDWVDKSYEVHLKGRVWRLRPKAAPLELPATATLNLPDRDERERRARARWLTKESLLREAQQGETERARAAAIGRLVAAGWAEPATFGALMKDRSADVRSLAAEIWPASQSDLREVGTDSDALVRAAALARLNPSLKVTDGWGEILLAFTSDDPFLRAAGRESLRRAPDLLKSVKVALLTDPRRQVDVLLTLRAAGEPIPPDIPALLASPDERVRLVATQWVGEVREKSYRRALEEHLERPDLSPELFSATLTSLALIDGAKHDEANTGGRVYLERILDDAKSSPALKARALRRLPADSKALSLERLRGWLSSDEAGLRLEAVRSLRAAADPPKLDLLAELATDEKKPPAIRAEAIVGLASDPRGSARELLWKLTKDAASPVRHEALRALRGAPLAQQELSRLREIPHTDSRVLMDALIDVAKAEDRPAPTDSDAWLARLDGPADAAAGERIFYHSKVGGCFRCHRCDGRGSDIGPDLSVTPQKMDRRKLIESILQPSKEIAPQFFVWQVQTDDGRTFIGTLVGETASGEQTYADAEGKLITVRRQEIAQKAAQRRSIMPDDVVKTLTVQELRDLLAFLSGAEPRPKP